MAKNSQYTVGHFGFLQKRQEKVEGLEIRNGIFKHVIANRQGHLVCVKLYANGWSIATGAGTLKTSVRLNDNRIEVSPGGNIRKGTLIMSEYVPLARPQKVDRIKVDTIHGEIELVNEKDTDIEILLEGKHVGQMKNIAGRGAEYDLPASISLSDAAILYCMGMLAVKYDDIDIV